MMTALATIAGIIVGATISWLSYRIARKHIMQSVALDPPPWPDQEALEVVRDRYTPLGLVTSPRRIAANLSRAEQLAAAHVCTELAERALEASRVFTYAAPPDEGPPPF